MPPGDHQVRMEFAYAGGGLGKAGTASLYVDGKKVGEGKISATTRPSSSLAMMVATWGWTRGLLSHRTTGRVGTSFQVASRASNWPLAEDAESLDHLVSPEDAIRIAIARQ